MAQEDQTLSPEAQARKRIDELEANLAKATDALAAANTHSKLVAAFASQGHKNAYDLATRAQSELSGTEGDIGEAASAWFDQQRQMFGVSDVDGSPPPAPSQPATPLKDQQPNLTAPGLDPKPVPVVVGSKEYVEQGWANKSSAEQIQAMREGALVTPEKVRIQQQDVAPFSR